MNRLKSKVREIITTAIVVVGVLAFRSSIAEPYQVPTGSMEPTILPGDRIFVMKTAYELKLPFTDIALAHFTEPQRGDVVVFKYPVDPTQTYVKRLIGLPGDEIVVSDGHIQINGHEMPQEFLHREGAQTTFYEEQLGMKNHLIQRLPHLSLNEPLKIKVPQDSYFFMGDNRDNSSDSRIWGFVPKAYIKGKAVVVWLSLDSAKSWLPAPRWNRVGKSL